MNQVGKKKHVRALAMLIAAVMIAASDWSVVATLRSSNVETGWRMSVQTPLRLRGGKRRRPREPITGILSGLKERSPKSPYYHEQRELAAKMRKHRKKSKRKEKEVDWEKELREKREGLIDPKKLPDEKKFGKKRKKSVMEDLAYLQRNMSLRQDKTLSDAGITLDSLMETRPHFHLMNLTVSP